MRKLLWQAARSYTELAYDRSMLMIKMDSLEACKWLMDVERKDNVWSMYKFKETVKFHYVTNNLVESFNNFTGFLVTNLWYY